MRYFIFYSGKAHISKYEILAHMYLIILLQAFFLLHRHIVFHVWHLVFFIKKIVSLFFARQHISTNKWRSLMRTFLSFFSLFICPSLDHLCECVIIINFCRGSTAIERKFHLIMWPYNNHLGSLCTYSSLNKLDLFQCTKRFECQSWKIFCILLCMFIPTDLHTKYSDTNKNLVRWPLMGWCDFYFFHWQVMRRQFFLNRYVYTL